MKSTSTGSMLVSEIILFFLVILQTLSSITICMGAY